jgi:hypothetical protein
MYWSIGSSILFCAKNVRQKQKYGQNLGQNKIFWAK